MNALAELGDRLVALNVTDTAELRTYLRDRFGIDLPKTANVVRVPEKVIPPTPTEFDVLLEGVNAANKLAVIHVVRELTGRGLAEAKATVEGGPTALLAGVDAATAEAARQKFEAAGARVAVRPA